MKNSSPQMGTPLWYLHKLLGELGKRSSTQYIGSSSGFKRQPRPSMTKLDAYYLGEYEAPWVTKLATAKYAKAFKDLIASVQDNWMALIVDAVEERLHVQGFRFGSEDAADAATWDIWQANNMDAESELLHTRALVTGSEYTMVWWDKDGEPLITVEDPLSVICGYATKSSPTPFVALKRWSDDWTGSEFAALYFERTIYTFKRGDDGWKITDVRNNQLGVVPVVEYSSRPWGGFRNEYSRGGRSEIAEFLSTQDQINKLVCDMLIAAEFGAFKQRWATGLELPPDKTDEDLLEASMARIFRNPAPDGKFGTFDATDLSGYIKAIENRIQSAASRSRTPPHYMLGNMGSFPSGESIRSAETGLSSKGGSRQRQLDNGHETTMRMCWLVKGDRARARATSAETVWKDVETRSESEHIDALGKMRTMLDIPPQALWQRAGFSPPEIQNFRTLLAEWALLAPDDDSDDNPFTGENADDLAAAGAAT